MTNAIAVHEPLDRIEWENGFRWFTLGHPSETARSSSESAGYMYGYHVWCLGTDPRTLTPGAAWERARAEREGL